MQLKQVLCFLILILFLVSVCQAQEIHNDKEVAGSYVEIDSWEPDDLENDEALYQESNGLVFPISSFSLSLIRIYQKRISSNSTIERCPYKTSCSSFAYQSISEKGVFIGILLFLDRYYYRENPSIPYNYPLYETEEGILKLNDDFYLTGEKY